MVGVVLVDEGEGDRAVAQWVGREQQGESAEVQLVYSKGPAEDFQCPPKIVGHVERLGVLAEAAVDEAVGQFQKELATQRGVSGLDAHPVVEDGAADLVVVAIAETDARRVGAKRFTAPAAHRARYSP